MLSFPSKYFFFFCWHSRDNVNSMLPYFKEEQVSIITRLLCIFFHLLLQQSFFGILNQIQVGFSECLNFWCTLTLYIYFSHKYHMTVITLLVLLKEEHIILQDHQILLENFKSSSEFSQVRFWKHLKICLQIKKDYPAFLIFLSRTFLNTFFYHYQEIGFIFSIGPNVKL